MKKIQMAVIGALVLASSSAFAADRVIVSDTSCDNLPTFTQLQSALSAAVVSAAGGTGTTNHGLDLPMWATLVNSSGRVCAVAKIGGTDPWPGSRVISAQKAYTANAFSTENVALSTANLFSAVQPGGSLYGLQHSNPVNPLFAYAGNSAVWGTATDPLIGKRIGGVNVFGGGLALYNASKKVIGAIGVSGDTSCADHEIAWKMRATLAALNITNGPVAKVPGGVHTATGGVTDDNIIYDITANTNGGTGVSAGGFGHALCGSGLTSPADNVTN